MALARRENPFELLNRNIASLWENLGWPWPTFKPEPWGFDTEERENEVVLRAEVPGFDMSDMEVTLRGNELTVRAEHKEPEGEAKQRRYARLERTMTLPAGINTEGIEARYHSGVLEVHLPRKPEAKPRRIEVKT
jgi:HSP20 family protein